MFTRNAERALYLTRAQRKRRKAFASFAFYSAIVLIVLACLLALKAAYSVYDQTLVGSLSPTNMSDIDNSLFVWLSWCFLSLVALGMAVLAWHFEKRHALILVSVAALVLVLDSSSLLAVMRTQVVVDTSTALADNLPDAQYGQGINGSVIMPLSDDLNRTELPSTAAVAAGNVSTDLSTGSGNNTTLLASLDSANNSAPDSPQASVRSLSGRVTVEHQDESAMRAQIMASANASSTTIDRPRPALSTPDVRKPLVAAKTVGTSAPPPIRPVSLTNAQAPLQAPVQAPAPTLDTSLVTDDGVQESLSRPVAETVTDLAESGVNNRSDKVQSTLDSSPIIVAAADSRENENWVDWVGVASPEQYTMQLFVAENERLAKDFINKHQLLDASYFIQRKGGSVYYKVVYGRYESLQLAKKAMKGIPESLRSVTPWVRSLASVQAEASPSS